MMQKSRLILFSISVCLLVNAVIISCTLNGAATLTDWDGKMATVYAPGDNEDLWVPGVGYPRIIEIQHNGKNNGLLLVVSQEESKTRATQGYPVFKSRDGGNTWEFVTEVREDDEYPPVWQPHLFELPRQLGDMPAGTLLLAACSINRIVHISALRVYRSYDLGKTWEMYSTIVTGGGAGDNGILSTGVWEPFLMMLDDGRLVCYYSDSTDAVNHSQEISYRVSSDGVTWSSTVKICSFEHQAERPGMSIVTRLDDGRYMMIYEIINGISGDLVAFKYSGDGLNWGDPADRGHAVTTVDGERIGSGPYIAYIPGIGKKGRIIVRATYQSPQAPAGMGTYLYYNDNYGEGPWEKRKNPTPYYVQNHQGYSACMFLSANKKILHLVCTVDNPDSDKNYSRIVYARLEEASGW